MVNKTPLRLVAIDGRTQTGDDQNGIPIISISDEEATTRKVPEAVMIAAHESSLSKPRQLGRWKTFLPAGMVAAVGLVVLIALATHGTKRPARSAVGPAVPSGQAATRQPSPPLPAPAAALPSRSSTVPEVIRVAITATPMEAVLSLDGNVVAGHRLNLEVPRDRAIHVVSAAAPGYVPFNQQVSFSSDVVLSVDLRRATTAPGRPAARARATPLGARPRNETRPTVLPSGARIEPGMNLERPSLRANAKPIDERNPYKP